MRILHFTGSTITTPNHYTQLRYIDSGIFCSNLQNHISKIISANTVWGQASFHNTFKEVMDTIQVHLCYFLPLLSLLGTSKNVSNDQINCPRRYICKKVFSSKNNNTLRTIASFCLLVSNLTAQSKMYYLWHRLPTGLFEIIKKGVSTDNSQKSITIFVHRFVSLHNINTPNKALKVWYVNWCIMLAVDNSKE